MNGWVKIHRKMLDWQWFNDGKMVQIFLYLLLSAAIEERKWRTITISRGQVITTVAEMSEKLQISVKSVRTCLDRLVESGEIGKQTTNKFTIITICKFEDYQLVEVSEGQTNGKQRANKGQTKGKQRANKGQTKGKQPERESAPRTPLKEKDLQEHKNRRIYYYSTNARTREEQQEQQFFFIFWLKGSADPRAEYENFLTWNTTPERAASWDSCPEYARYSAASRWTVKGAKMTGYTDIAGKAFTALVNACIKRVPDLLPQLYDPKTYPCRVADSAMTISCRSDSTATALESNIDIVRRILGQHGIKKLHYLVNGNK